MSKPRAEQIIVISLVVMMASVVGGGLAGHKNLSRTGKVEKGTKYYGKAISGGFLTMLFLSLFAEVSPTPAAYMSIAISSYAFFHYGLPVLVPKEEPAPNLRNPAERLPFTPGPEVSPEPLPNFGGLIA